MGTAAWPLLLDPLTPNLPVTPPSDPGAEQVSDQTLFGCGVARPLRRDRKLDYASATGARLISACLGQVLGTACDNEFAGGEIPWRTEFGSKLHLLRLRLNSQALAEQAQRFVVDAAQRWEPRVRVKRSKISRASAPTGGLLNLLAIHVTFDLVDRASGEVLAKDLEATTYISAGS
jgi:phage baseplate assembly protein W